MTVFRTKKRDTVEKLFVSLIGVQMLSFISQIIANVIDAIVIKRCLGSEAMAAFSFANTATSIEMAVFGFLMTGVSILLSRNVNEQDGEKRNGAYSTAVILSLALGGVLTFAYLAASEHIARLSGAPEQLQGPAAEYIRGNALGILPYLLFSVLSGTALVSGRKKQLMLSFSLMAAIDVVLDLLNGYVVHMGLWGMGAATAVSQLAGFAVVFLLRGGKKGLFRFAPGLFHLSFVKDIFIYGYIYVIKQLMITALGYIYNNFITRRYGPDLLAVYASTMSALSLLQCISSAIGNTASTLSGFYGKEEDGASLKSLMRAAVKYSVLFNAAVMLLALLAAAPIMTLFYKAGDSSFDTAVMGLRLFSLSIVFRSINMALRGYYQSMKMQACNIVFTFMHTLGCEVLCLFVLNALIGIPGIWLSFPAGEVLALLLMFAVLRIRSGEKRFPEVMMLLPPAFRGETASGLDASCHSADEVMDFSRMVASYCEREGASKRAAGILSLAVEEIAGNIVRYGFGDGRPHSIDIRVKKKTNGWILRFHDDCRGFDPTKYLREPDDAPGDHNGIRMVRGLASEISYTNALGLNHLLIGVKRS